MATPGLNIKEQRGLNLIHSSKDGKAVRQASSDRDADFSRSEGCSKSQPEPCVGLELCAPRHSPTHSAGHAAPPAPARATWQIPAAAAGRAALPFPATK